jgi:hypothetical protein
MSGLIDDINSEQRDSEMDDLRTAHNRTLRKLSAAKASKEELVEAVYRAARDAAEGFDLRPVARPTRDARRRSEEVAVPLLGDLQLAKVTPDYNTDVAEERVELFGDKIVELTEIQRADHPVKRANIIALGDIIEGELIFPGQSFLVDASLYRQVTVDGPRIVGNFIRKMLGTFDTVHVDWVIGNHGAIGGRARRDMDPESNADRMLGRILASHFEAAGEKRVTFNIPEGRHTHWYTVARVGNWSAMCFHGNQIVGHSGFPWYGLGKKVNSWASGGIPESFGDVCMGHYHQMSMIPLNKRRVWANGSTESTNMYAAENMAAQSDPGQWLLFVHPEKGRVTATYPVDLSR